ncbi:hypothetical protein KR018_002103, partial [Drosophila ironensis]
FSVNGGKYEFRKKSVSFLGFIVTCNGATTDPEKVKAIKEFPETKSVFEVKKHSDREVNYATNERELLAIIWALAKLRHYLYAVKDIKFISYILFLSYILFMQTSNIDIYTHHQPLTFAVSESNPNAKIKRWKARIDESGAKMFYKPGKENLVADALSRRQLNVVEAEEAYSCEATIHSEVSLTHTIETTEKPLNCFQNQITLEEARSSSKRSFVLFGNKRRHDIDFTCM